MTRRSLFVSTGFILSLCFQLAVSPAALAKQGQGHGKGKGHDKHEKHHGKSDDNGNHNNKEKGPKVKHRGMDANGDGVISREEWRGNDVSFRNQDWNGDGRLTGDELRPGAKRPQQDDQAERARLEERRLAEQDLFHRLDTNRDSVISRYEFQGGNDLFDRLDQNRDGILNQDELLRMDAEQGLVSSLVGKVKEKIGSFFNWLF